MEITLKANTEAKKASATDVIKQVAVLADRMAQRETTMGQDDIKDLCVILTLVHNWIAQEDATNGRQSHASAKSF